jgi:hypothetical protein
MIWSRLTIQTWVRSSAAKAARDTKLLAGGASCIPDAATE